MAKLLTDENHPVWFNILISGHSGSGKSSVGATAPQALICLSEAQGRVSIKQRARMLKREQPRVIYMECLQDYRDVIKALHQPRKESFSIRWTPKEQGADGEITTFEGWWPQSVVLDSLTDACNHLRDEITRDHPLPRDNKTGMRMFTLQHWGQLKDRGMLLIRAFRDVPVHTVFLCQLQERLSDTSDGEKTRVVGPELPGRSLAVPLVQCVNLSGFMEREVEHVAKSRAEYQDAVLTWRVRTVGHDYELVKPSRPLHDYEVPDIADWMKRLDLESAQPLGEGFEEARREMEADYVRGLEKADEAGVIDE